MPDEVVRFLTALGSTILWSIVSIVIVAVVFEVLEKRYRLLDEIFKENSVAAGVFAASIVLGIFYTVTQIVIHCTLRSPMRGGVGGSSPHGAVAPMNPHSGTTIWLARHGEVHNPDNVLYGRMPRMRLTPEGQRQARALAEFLSARPLAAVYSSPLLRARRTAEAIVAGQPGLGRVRIDSDLIEVRTAWEGHPLASLEAIGWDFYTNPRHPADDSLDGIHARMQRWVRRMLRRHAGGEAVGVSHGDPVLILVGALRGLPLDPRRLFPQPYIEPGTVYRLRFDGSGTFRGSDVYVPHAEVAA